MGFPLRAVDASGAVGAAVAGGDVRLDGTELADPEGVGVGGLSDVRAGGGVLEELLNLHGKAGSENTQARPSVVSRPIPQHQDTEPPAKGVWGGSSAASKGVYARQPAQHWHCHDRSCAHHENPRTRKKTVHPRAS